MGRPRRYPKPETGDVYARLTVLENDRGRIRCRCECGAEKTIAERHLTNGAIRSCGCLRVENGERSPSEETRQKLSEQSTQRYEDPNERLLASQRMREFFGDYQKAPWVPKKQRYDHEGVVYALVDPRDGCIRYVGWTCHLNRRLGEHAGGALTGEYPVQRWIRKLTSFGLEPQVVILEVEPPDKDKAEIRHIAEARRKVGSRLLNIADGGVGPPTRLGVPHTEEAKRRISEGTKRWWKTYHENLQADASPS